MLTPEYPRPLCTLARIVLPFCRDFAYVCDCVSNGRTSMLYCPRNPLAKFLGTAGVDGTARGRGGSQDLIETGRQSGATISVPWFENRYAHGPGLGLWRIYRDHWGHHQWAPWTHSRRSSATGCRLLVLIYRSCRWMFSTIALMVRIAWHSVETPSKVVPK